MKPKPSTNHRLGKPKSSTYTAAKFPGKWERGNRELPKETGNKSKLRSIPLGTGLRLNRSKINPLFRKCQVT